MATQTLTFLFADIEGSTAMSERLGDARAELLADHHQLIRAALAAHRGEEVVTGGHRVAACSLAAPAWTRRLMCSGRWSCTADGGAVPVRMGVDSGEVSRTAAGLAGGNARRAARTTAVAHAEHAEVSAPGGLLAGWLLGVWLTALGRHRLAGRGRAGLVFQLRAVGLPAGFLPRSSLEEVR